MDETHGHTVVDEETAVEFAEALHRDMDERLDEALLQSFDCGDPVAISIT